MRFFNMPSQNQNSEEAKKRQEASCKSLAAGGLPLNATDRLREQASRQGKPDHIFTSNLSVNELAVIHHAGYEPLGQVMGSTVYHVGWQYLPTYGWVSGELETLTQAFYNARRLALTRLQQEAEMLHASDVVGVRLGYNAPEEGMGALEFTAIGSAIRRLNTPSTQTPPRLSALSGEDFWLLRNAGFQPLGIAIGNCTWYEIASYNTMMATQGGFFGAGLYNQELTDYTQAVMQSRALASYRMDLDARSLGAEGVVGVTVNMDTEQREVEVNQSKRIDMIVHFLTIGTAISHTGEASGKLTINNAVDLRDPI